MKPIIQPLVATLSTLCCMASLFYSPRLVWAIVTCDEDWRLELLRPQIASVPPLVHAPVALVFGLLALWMCTDVSAAYPNRRWIALGGCVLAVCFVVVHWLFFAHWSVL